MVRNIYIILTSMHALHWMMKVLFILLNLLLYHSLYFLSSIIISALNILLCHSVHFLSSIVLSAYILIWVGTAVIVHARMCIRHTHPPHVVMSYSNNYLVSGKLCRHAHQRLLQMLTARCP